MFVCFLRKFKHQLSVCFLRKKKHIRSKSSSSSIGKSNHVFGCIPIFLAKARTSLVILTPPKTTLLQIQFRFHLRSERVGVHLRRNHGWKFTFVWRPRLEEKREERAIWVFGDGRKHGWRIAPIGTWHKEAARELLLRAEHRWLLLRPRSPIETPPDSHGPQLVQILLVLCQRVYRRCRQAQPWWHQYLFQLGRWASPCEEAWGFWVLLRQWYRAWHSWPNRVIRFNEFLNLFLFLLEFILR